MKNSETVYLREDLERFWQGRSPFDQARRQEGEIYRAREGRRTLRFEGDSGKRFFLKYHGGIGWKEILKNLTQLKMPVLSALQEVQAIKALDRAGLASMRVVGYGARGCNPATRQSFIVTEELADTISLEDLGEQWLAAGTTPLAYKRALVRQVAEISRRMHGAGINHRDYYLAHFLVNASAALNQNSGATLHLIDLHRSQVRQRVPWRWQVKDLGGLYFSSARYGLTRRDVLRFVRGYFNEDLRTALKKNRRLLMAAKAEAEKIYRRYYEIEPEFPLQFCEHPGKEI